MVREGDSAESMLWSGQCDFETDEAYESVPFDAPYDPDLHDRLSVVRDSVLSVDDGYSMCVGCIVESGHAGDDPTADRYDRPVYCSECGCELTIVTHRGPFDRRPLPQLWLCPQGAVGRCSRDLVFSFGDRDPVVVDGVWVW